MGSWGPAPRVHRLLRMPAGAGPQDPQTPVLSPALPGRPACVKWPFPGWGAQLIHPLPGCEVTFPCAHPVRRGRGPLGDRLAPSRQAPRPTLRDSGVWGGLWMAPVPGGAFERKRVRAGWGGGWVCMNHRHRLQQATPKTPQESKGSRQAPGTHPRLSLKRGHQAGPASAVPTPGRRASRLFPC